MTTFTNSILAGDRPDPAVIKVEGHAFAELGEVEPLMLVRKQHDLIRRSMRGASAR